MNQVAVVIGGGQTLGAFLCHGLAAEGYRVAVVDIRPDIHSPSPGVFAAPPEWAQRLTTIPQRYARRRWRVMKM